MSPTYPLIPYTIVHSIRGRIRYHIPLLRSEKNYSQRLEAVLHTFPEITGTRTNHTAASIVINYNPELIEESQIKSKIINLILVIAADIISSKTIVTPAIEIGNFVENVANLDKENSPNFIVENSDKENSPNLDSPDAATGNFVENVEVVENSDKENQPNFIAGNLDKENLPNFQSYEAATGNFVENVANLDKENQPNFIAANLDKENSPNFQSYEAATGNFVENVANLDKENQPNFIAGNSDKENSPNLDSPDAVTGNFVENVANLDKENSPNFIAGNSDKENSPNFDSPDAATGNFVENVANSDKENQPNFVVENSDKENSPNFDSPDAATGNFVENVANLDKENQPNFVVENSDKENSPNFDSPDAATGNFVENVANLDRENPPNFIAGNSDKENSTNLDSPDAATGNFVENVANLDKENQHNFIAGNSDKENSPNFQSYEAATGNFAENVENSDKEKSTNLDSSDTQTGNFVENVANSDKENPTNFIIENSDKNNLNNLINQSNQTQNIEPKIINQQTIEALENSYLEPTQIATEQIETPGQIALKNNNKQEITTTEKDYLDDIPDEIEMSLFDHLEELRQRIFYSLISVIIAAGGSFFAVKPIVQFLEIPAQKVKFIQIAPGEYFFVSLKTAAYSGILLATPFILYQIIQFVLPGLTRRERSFLAPIVFGSSILFIAGLAFAYIALIPAALNFLITYGEGVVEQLLSIDRYFEFILLLMLSTGLAFQIPVIQMLLGLLGIVTSKQMLKGWRYVLLGGAILGAILTPSTDPITQILLAGAVVGLYFGGVGAVKLLGR